MVSASTKRHSQDEKGTEEEEGEEQPDNNDEKRRSKPPRINSDLIPKMSPLDSSTRQDWMDPEKS